VVVKKSRAKAGDTAVNATANTPATPTAKPTSE
jgi:hypothetical protein